MRVPSVKIYNNYQTQVNIPRTQNISFKSRYTDIINEIAEKYQYVKDNWDLIYNELNEYYFSWEIKSSMISDVKGRIEELKRQRMLRDARLQNMTTYINSKEREIQTEGNVHSQLKSEMNNLQRKSAIEKIKLSKTVASYDRVSEVNTQLEDKYVNLFKLEEKKFPNAIMVIGLQDDTEKSSVIDFLNRTNCKVYKTDFNNIPLDNVVKEINSFAAKIKKSGEHSILYINNFDKYTVPTEENMDFISKFKGFLCACSKKFDTTILVFENNPRRLDENIIGGHRFEKKINVSAIKEEVSFLFCPKYDGYTFFYGENENDCVDLYLGDYGKNPDLLWVDTTSYKKVRDVLDRLDEIKAQDKFKYTKYVQIPYPSSTYGDGFYVLPYRRTQDGRLILEREI